MTCTIEAKVLPLLSVAGHLYIDIFDDNGKRILQVNGFATDRASKKIKAIGAPDDQLMAYLDAVLASSAVATRNDHPHKGAVLFQGSRADIDKAIKAMAERAVEINAKDVPYRILELNSNTVFMEMVTAMMQVLPIDLVAADKISRSKILLPGVKSDFRKTATAPVAKTPGIKKTLKKIIRWK